METTPHIKDWFNRDSGTFTFVTDEDRIGWEDSLETGQSYCEYLLRDAHIGSDKEAIRKGIELTRNTVTSMDTPHRVRINYSKTDNYTDGKTIVLSTGVFEDEELNYFERIDVFVGEGVHETAHIIYTDFDVLHKLFEGIPTLPTTDEEKEQFFRTKTVKNIINIIEDERIENLVGYDYPGHARYLGQIKHYMFDNQYLKAIDKGGKPLTKGEHIMDIFFKIIRYPKYLTEIELIDWEITLNSLKDTLTPLPTSTKEVEVASQTVYDILKEFYDKSVEEEMASGEGEGEGEGKGKPTSFGESASSGEVSEAMDKMLTSSASKETSAGKEVEVSSTFTKSVGEKTAEGESLTKLLYDEEGAYERGTTKDVYFYKANSNQSAYMNSFARVNRFASALGRVLKFESKDYRIVTKSCRTGHLDTSKIAEAIQGVPTVYERMGEVKSNKISVCLLIDESGSMSGTKISKAVDCAVLFQEALKKNSDVELFIYGHSGDMRYSGATEIWIYKEPGFKTKYTLGSSKARSQNRDGDAILETAKRVRKFTHKPTVMFVISDGQPAADGYYGRSAITDTRNKVKAAERLGMNIIQIAIQGDVPSEEMFSNYVKLLDINSLPRDLGMLMKKVTRDMIKTTTVHH